MIKASFIYKKKEAKGLYDNGVNTDQLSTCLRYLLSEFISKYAIEHDRRDKERLFFKFCAMLRVITDLIAVLAEVQGEIDIEYFQSQIDRFKYELLARIGDLPELAEFMDY